MLVFAVCGILLGRRSSIKALSTVYLVYFSFHVAVAVWLGEFCSHLLVIPLIFLVLIGYAYKFHHLFRRDIDTEIQPPPLAPVQECESDPIPENDHQNNLLRMYLAYTWDFLFGVVLIFGVPLIIFIVVSVFLMFLSPDWDALSCWVRFVYMQSMRLACLVGPLGVFLAMINYRKMHRVLPHEALAVEIACAVILFVSLMIVVMYLALSEAVADGIL